MTDRNAGLEIDVGLTLDKILRQNAKIEARLNRTAQNAEAKFRRSNRNIEASFDRVASSATAVQRAAGGHGLRMMSLQLSQVAQQGAATGQYLRALSIQLPDLMLGFGTAGILIGAAAGSLGPLILNMLGASDATDKLVESLTSGAGGLESARSSIDQLRDLQERYTAAIEASGAAAGPAADKVIESTRREFEARRQLVMVERELLRLRGAEMRIERDALQSDLERRGRRQAGANSSGANGGNFLDPSLRPYVNGAPRSAADVLGDQFLSETEKQRLAVEKLNAEIRLRDMALDELTSALNGDQRSIDAFRPPAAGGSASSGGGGRGRSGGGGGGGAAAAGDVADWANEARDALEGLRGEVQGLGLESDVLRGQFAAAFGSMVTGANSLNDALAQVAAQLAGMFARAAGGHLFDLAVGGTGLGDLFANARGNVFQGGRVLPFARGAVVDGPTVFPMRGATGLMGEAGPEAILPLKRGPGGRLGVEAGGSGGPQITYAPVIDARGADAAAVARLERALAEDRANFAARVAGVNRSAARSGAADAWRG